MPSELNVVSREAFFIKKEDIGKELSQKLIDKYTYRFYTQAACDACEWACDRHSDICDDCGAYKGGVSLAKQVSIGDSKTKYISTPAGDLHNLKKMLGSKYEIKLTHKYKKDNDFKRRIKFTGTLREHQEESVAAIYARKRGVIKAAPRSGKCIEGSSLIMTDNGVSRIDTLFSDFELPKNGEFYAKSDLSIATVAGERSIKNLYSKVVDQTIRITTDRGYKIRGTLNHRILVLNSSCDLVWKHLADVVVGDYVAHSRKESWLGTSRDLNKYNPDIGETGTVHQTPKTLTRELARVLGYLTANGSLNRGLNDRKGTITFTSNNQEVMDDYFKCMNTCFPTISMRLVPRIEGVRATEMIVSSVHIKQFLEQACDLPMCKAAGKYIPETIMRGAELYMLEFLGAYVSCDSWIHHTGIQLCSASSRLIRELHSVLSYMGCIAQFRQGEGYARNGTGTVRKYYNLHLHLLDARSFLRRLNVLKAQPLSKAEFVDTNDVLPYVKDVLHNLQQTNGTQMTWNIKGKNIFKTKIGKLLYRPKGQLTRSGHFNRNGINNVNMPLVKMLDRKVYDKIQKMLRSEFYFSPVVTAELINKPIRVYDVEVPEKHHFVANTIVNHNTVLSTAAICHIGKKTIILGAQRAWLLGFRETFVGSKTQKPLTNAKESQVGLCKTYADFMKYDVCLSTPHIFRSEKGQKLLAKLRDVFHVMVVDEVHGAAANKYASVIARLNTRYRIGLSGTPERKDCVAPDTKVTMGNGTNKEIKDIVIGDIVKSFNTDTGSFINSSVLEVHKRTITECLKVTIDDMEIVCTPDHKFWVHNKNMWICAKDLTPQDWVLIY